MGVKSGVGRNKAGGHVGSMKIEADFPDITEEAAKEPEQGLRILTELACRLYEKDIITFGQGMRMTGLDLLGFQKELCKREIPRMTLESFMLELNQKPAHAHHQ